MSQAQFLKAVEIVRKINEDKESIELGREEKLALYKYYKQATEGDNTTTKPSESEFVEVAKWEAWTSVKGISQEDAGHKYVDCFFTTLKKHDNEEAKKHVAEVEALA